MTHFLDLTVALTARRHHNQLYPVPPKEATTGVTEEIIGRWLAKGGPELRSKIILASKVHPQEQ